MKSVLVAATAASVLVALSTSTAFAQNIDPNGPIAMQRDARAVAPAAVETRPFEALIAAHAAANGIPAELVHRVIVRESRYRANAVGRGGASGLMQIKVATARGMGYRGTAAGLLVPETNLTYGVRYLAGAYRAAGGHHGRTISYYASGYYGKGVTAAKRPPAPVAAAFAQ